MGAGINPALNRIAELNVGMRLAADRGAEDRPKKRWRGFSPSAGGSRTINVQWSREYGAFSAFRPDAK